MTRATRRRGTRRRAASAWGLALALLGAGARAAGAQEEGVTERTSPHLRNDCRLAAQILETGHPQPHSDWALETIGRCEESAGPALAALWTAPAAEPEALEQLYRATAQLRDQRVYDAVARAAEDGGSPTIVRLTALRVLAAYVDPGAVVPLDYLTEADPSAYRAASRDHATQIEGAVPLAADVRAPVRELLLRLSGEGADAPTARAATYLLRRLSLN